MYLLKQNDEDKVSKTMYCFMGNFVLLMNHKMNWIRMCLVCFSPSSMAFVTHRNISDRPLRSERLIFSAA